MEKRSKTNKEIFETLYPAEVLKEKPMACAEALGYLNALIQYFPSERAWASCKQDEILLMILFHTL